MPDSPGQTGTPPNGSSDPGTPGTGSGTGPQTPLVRSFRVVAVVEAVSYLLLIAASIAKRVFHAADLVPLMGPVHGVIFLVYLVLALSVREHLRWELSTTLLVVVAAVIPLGGIYVEHRLGAPASPTRRA